MAEKASRGTKRSRSRSRNTRRTKLKKNENESKDHKNSSEEMISLYSASTETKNELEALLRKEHNQYMKQKKEAHDKISTILNSMSSKQEQRYECWNRSVIPKKIVKSIMNNVLNKHSSNSSKKKSNIDDKSVIVVQALAKCLVMEIVAKSREIQIETIAHFIEVKNREKADGANGDNDGNKEVIKISYPPLFMDDDGDGDQNKVDEQEECVKGIDLLVDKEEKEKNDGKIENDINEDFVLGAIRPIHIREALRKLQHDKASFFCSQSKLFGSE